MRTGIMKRQPSMTSFFGVKGKDGAPDKAPKLVSYSLRRCNCTSLFAARRNSWKPWGA